MSQKSELETVVTIDIGSGSCRALAWDIVGNIVGVSQQEWEYEVSEYPGGLDFNTEKGWNLIIQCLQELFSSSVNPKNVRAITSTSMREGFVLYDKNGKEIWAIPNVDARAQKEAEDLLESGYGESFFSKSGDWTSLAASARLLWIKRNLPEVWESAAHMTMLSDWVINRLTGEYISDPTIGSSSALFDLAERDWSTEITDVLGATHLMPKVIESGTFVGNVKSEICSELGISELTPVYAGGADTQMGLLGGGIVEPGELGIVGGTYWLTAGLVDTPLVDSTMELRTLCHAVPGEWMVEGCGFAHGLATRWVRDQLVRAANSAIAIDDAYEILDRDAANIPPGANGVSYFSSGVMNTRVWKHPSPTIVGVNPLSDKNTGISSIFRAVLESTCYVARGHVEMISNVTGNQYRETTFLGGASRSPLWSQMLADILKLDVKVPDVSEATCLGAALCAWAGLGRFTSIKEAANSIEVNTKTYTPNRCTSAQYDDLYMQWRKLCDYQLAAADQGLTEYMWVGAGAKVQQEPQLV